MKEKIKEFTTVVKKQWFLLLITVPFIIYIAIFSYIPLVSWVWSLFNYEPGVALSSENFVGLFHFKTLFTDSSFWNAVRNTVILSTLNITLGTIISIGFAVFLNELNDGKIKKTVQTISYLPHFVSWVVVASIFSSLLSPTGVVNNIFIAAGLLEKPIYFLLEGNLYYWLATFCSIWKETGWLAIIYISAITGINRQLYSAAYIDGCGRFKRIWHVTLPGIRPTIIVLLILNIGWVFSTGFDQGILFKTGGNFPYSDVLGTYIYRYGLKSGEYSLATAAGIFQSVISFTLVIVANKISKKLFDTALF